MLRLESEASDVLYNTQLNTDKGYARQNNMLDIRYWFT